MRNGMIGPKYTLTMFGAVLAGGLLIASAQPAAAWTDSGWGYDSGYGYDSFEAEEDREWAQESEREAGRAVRRNEIEAKKEADSAEHAAYTDALIQSSKASLQAPKGVYYRKPGFISTEPPGSNAQVIEESGVKVFVDQGIFWVKQGEQYLVIAAPYGVVLDKIPAATTRVATKSGEYGYFFGTFYQRKGDKFVVVKPPAGLNVTYLPDGYQDVGTKDATLYQFGNTTFKPVFVLGVLVYQVV